MTTVVKVEALSKHYRLGLIGGGTLRDDVARMIAKMRGKPDPLLTIDEFSIEARKQDEIWALRDINFSVEQGEVLGIIGHNGAGKSTLLKLLSRITAPTAGRIKIRGRVGSLLEVGTGFHPELTGRENIYLNGAILGMRREEVSQKLEQIVEFAEMARFIDTPVKRYSSGMSVRLAFSVAAHLEPEILIVDEVLAVGDLAFQQKCLGKMSDISSEGRTVLFVSHNMAAVDNLCSRAILLSDGKLKDSGSTSEMISAYRSTTLGRSHEGPLSAIVDLEKFRRPKPSMSRILTRLTVGKGSRSCLSIPAGGELKLTIEVVSEMDFSSQSLGLGFKNEFKETICHFTTEMDSGVADLTQSKRLTANLQNLPLIPGRYSIDVAVFRGRQSVTDLVEDVIEIEIHDTDFYGTGVSLSKDWGKFLMTGTWSADENED